MSERFDYLARGFVIGRTTTKPSGRDTTGWWYGPDRGLGTTWGPLDYSVAVFPTKARAMDDARTCGYMRREVFALAVPDALEFALTELVAAQEVTLVAFYREAPTADARRMEWWEQVNAAQRARRGVLEAWISERKRAS